ncbi:acyl-CoA dehydrogenase family protein [Rhizorhabdus sp.]|jgi:alkylation response protein AidB-like acyl-CoA dehydrogenase|uniref:acyl-CoA dehydrogenase family protein n=1 Tax=Rhizorhabdus sp. TaxID=1968843 RepID=UPI0019BE71B8|nr:acyl-CoA dehydrogenase family protein [Rhizorhabdus sp.]MBD3759616.1 acyl-CoA dehydrogenase family protein [Rhizorhabdus sp.]
MNLVYTSEQIAFRDAIRAFLASCWDRGRAKDAAFVDQFRIFAVEAGYIYRAVPKVYGGAEQEPDVVRAQIIREEFGKVRAPLEVPGNGVALLVPTLLEWGTAAQKEMFIEPTVRGRFRWAQGYSEPGAGSDLASLSSRATLEPDGWRINGQKIWTTLAQDATHMFALLRTEPDAPKHQGISYILLDMKQPGVTVRPIKQINGDSEFCEVFLDDAHAPADWLVGPRGRGWEVSRSTLKHERNHIGSAARTMPMFHSLVRLAERRELHGRPAIEHASIRNALVTIEGYLQSQLWAGYFQQTLSGRGEHPGVLGLVNKLTTTNLFHRIAALAAEIIGDDALKSPKLNGDRGGDERWVNQMLGSLGQAISGGTSNIQRNIISERGLGLPRDGKEP